jgi:hypothetical protein
MDKKHIIRKIKEEIENLKLHVYMLEMIMANFEDIEND